MGGRSGGGISLGDLQRLEAKAKESLKQAESRHVFISFSHDDMDEVNLLRGQAKNENTALEFDDHSVKVAYNSDNAEYIKREIRDKIDRVSVTLVYLSDNSAISPWVNWEIQESIQRGKGVIGVYKGDQPPKNLPESFTKNHCKTVKWTHEGLYKAIIDASNSRN